MVGDACNSELGLSRVVFSFPCLLKVGNIVMSHGYCV